MYFPNKKPGTWTIADISRFLGRDPKVVKKEIVKKGFPKPTKLGSRNYWNEIEVIRYYSKRK